MHKRLLNLRCLSSHVPGEPPALSINSISTQSERAISSRMESHQAHYGATALGLDSKQTFRIAPKICPHLIHCCWNSTRTGSLGILCHSNICPPRTLLPYQPPAKHIWSQNLSSQLRSDLLAAAGCFSQGLAGHSSCCLCFHIYLC